MHTKAGYTANSLGDISVTRVMHSSCPGEPTHDVSSTYPNEHMFYAPPRLVNLGLVGNQQNECSALRKEQANTYIFRRRLMFPNCV